MSIGVPVKLMHEAKLHVVTVELKTGEVYRGYLVEAEDNMNCRLDSCQMTARDGKNAYLEQIRGLLHGDVDAIVLETFSDRS